jgi:flagella basal body P-ring formation protein FlgA
MNVNSAPIRFVLALGIMATVFSVGVSSVSRLVSTTPAQAIERAVAQKIGGDVSVQVTALQTEVASEAGLAAQLDPAARLGQPMRVIMLTNGLRRGAAVATVQAIARFARASRAIARDEAVSASDIDIVTGELPAMTLRRLPAPGEVVGLKARRAIAAGEALTSAVLQVPPSVKSGDKVTVRVAIGNVEVTGSAIASGTGNDGEIIRILQPNTRRLVKARIIGPGSVEVVE